MVKVLIIDDEALARQRVRKLLESRPEIEILAECRTGHDAVRSLQTLKPDLIFLDIQMKDMNGFQVLDQVPKSRWPLTIFVTAFEKYAIRAFEIFAFDYLLKPFKDDRFYTSLDKAIAMLQLQGEEDYLAELRELVDHLKEGQKSSSEPLALKQGSKISLVHLEDIRYVVASGYYIEVYVSETKRLLLRESMTNMLEQLAADNFMRIHRSTIINMDYLAEVQHTGAGDVVVKMTDNKVFRVSKTYKEELFGRLKV